PGHGGPRGWAAPRSAGGAARRATGLDAAAGRRVAGGPAPAWVHPLALWVGAEHGRTRGTRARLSLSWPWGGPQTGWGAAPWVPSTRGTALWIMSGRRQHVSQGTCFHARTVS